MNYSPRLVSTLNDIAYQFAPMMQKSIVEVLSQPRYSNTGAAADSVKVIVREGNESTAPAIQVTFADHLIMLNQRKIEWTRLPNMEKMLAWADTKKSTKQEAEKLAFAVAWDKRKNDTWKPKLWRKRSLSQVLKDMNEELLRRYDEAVDADLGEVANAK